MDWLFPCCSQVFSQSLLGAVCFFFGGGFWSGCDLVRPALTTLSFVKLFIPLLYCSTLLYLYIMDLLTQQTILCLLLYFLEATDGEYKIG